jgi:predicted nucleic acid-binding protein
MSRYLLDSDFLIEFLRGRLPARRYLETLDGELWISALTIAELWAGSRPGSEEETLTKFVFGFRVQPVTEGIARRGGELRRQYGPSHGTGLVDALLAASAEVLDSPLITFNIRHFPMLKRVVVPYERVVPLC